MSELAKGIQDEHLEREAAEAMQKEQDLLGQLSDIQKNCRAERSTSRSSSSTSSRSSWRGLEKELQQ